MIFETAAGDPLPLGRTEYRSVTVSNIGQSDLRITPDLDDPTGDYTFSPTVVPPLPPGGTVVFSVLYTPTQPSDPFNPESPQRSADAFFRIESNDTEQLLSTVDLKGYAVSGLADDFLTIEMSFLNNSSNWAQNDFEMWMSFSKHPVAPSLPKANPLRPAGLGPTRCLSDVE